MSDSRPGGRMESAVGPVPQRASQTSSGLDAFCGKAIFAVVLFAVLWGPLAFGGVPPAAFVVTQALTVLALVLWVMRVWSQRSFRMHWPPLNWAVLVFLLYAVIRCQFVPVKFFARVELMEIVVYASLFFLVLNNFNRRDSAATVTLVLATLGMVLAWLAVFQFATNYPKIWGVIRRAQFMGRGSGTYINPNHLAGFLAMMVPLVLANLLFSRASATRKVFLAYCALVMIGGICVSLSRGGILAAVGALVIFCLFVLSQKGFKSVALIIAAVLVIFGVVFKEKFNSLQERFEIGFEHGRVSDVRTQYWRPALHIFAEHPIWGGGPAQFDEEFNLYRPPIVQGRPVFAHNDYLNTLSDWGAAGLAIVLTACGLLYYGAWKMWPILRQADLDLGRMQRTDRSAFVFGASIGLVALLFHSVVDFDMHVPANAIIAVVLMALLSAHWRFVTERYWWNPRLAGKIGLTMVALTAAGWLGMEDIARGREVYWQHLAQKENATGQDQLAWIKKAWAAEPNDFENSYNIGEFYRLTSLQGESNYAEMGRMALPWYERSVKANPLDSIVNLRWGMCLDWLGQTNQATAYFDRAHKLDPFSNEVEWEAARHEMELGNWAGARRKFQHSLDLQWNARAAWSLHELNDRIAETNGLIKN